jgi:hypothetical protein
MTAKKNVKIKTAVKISGAFFIALMAFSCVTSETVLMEIDLAVSQADYTAAIDVIVRGQEGKNAIYSEENAVLLFLDKGLLEYYAGNYVNSSNDLQNAERLIEEAYTKSILENFSSYIINDNTKEYPGEDFEDIYINIFNALNYYNRGDTEGALAEIRKLSMSGGKLDMLSRKYEYTDPFTGASLNEMTLRATGIGDLPRKGQVNFSNLALARFLGALFYLGGGNTNAARIEFDQLQAALSNRNIYRTPIPQAIEQARSVPDGKARLNIISFTGLSPIKQEKEVYHYLPFFHHPVLQFAVFKLPAIVRRPGVINRIEAVIEGRSFDLELLEDIGVVIEETFAARYSNILTKTYIRTLLKYAVADIAAMDSIKRHGELAGLMTAITAKTAMDLSEEADTRMSRYLPDKAYIGGINLDPGVYSVIINYYNGNNLITGVEYRDVTVNQNGLNLLESVNLK